MLYNLERPHTFDQMEGQKVAVESIRKQAILDQFMNVYIFHGQYGSGKTSMAQIVALAANCPKDEFGNPDCECQTAKDILSENCSDFMEIDGASKAGVDEVRKLIEDTAYQPYSLKKKIYVIDEAHMLSKAAFHALLKTLEEPPDYAIFILCTTDFKAIPATIRSRAACYCFSKISNEDITRKLLEVSGRHGIKTTETACALIAKNSDGSLRNAESLLEQAAVSNHHHVTEDTVSKMIGISDPAALFSFLKNILHGDIRQAAETATQLLNDGKDLNLLADDMIEIVTDAIILSYGGETKLLHTTTYYQDLQKDLVCQGTPEDFIRLSKELLELSKEIRAGAGKTTLLVSVIQMGGAIKEERTLHSLQEDMEEVKRKLNSYSMEQIALSNEEENTEKSNNISKENKQSVWNTAQTADSKNKSNILMEQISVEILKKSPKNADRDNSILQDFMEFQSFFEGDMQNTGDNEPDDLLKADIEPISKATQEVFDKVKEIAEDDAAFYAAVYEGAKAEIVNGCVTYATPLKPIAELLRKYFEVFSIPAKAVFHKAVSI